MLNWLTVNKDGLLGNILVTILFIPISYIFNIAIDNWKKKKRGQLSNSENLIEHHNNKIKNTVPEKHYSESKQTTIIREKVVVYKNGQSTGDDDAWIIIVIGLFVMAAIVWFFNTYKNTISNVICWISIFGFVFSTVTLCREFRHSSTKGLKSLLAWTSLLWIFLLGTIYFLYNPFYISKEAISTQMSIQNGGGVLDAGMDGFFYLSYQVLGFLSSIILLLFNLGGQIYCFFAWWNENREYNNIFKRKMPKTIYKFLYHFYNPVWKYIVFSILFVAISFGMESGLIMMLFKNH